jgi:ribosomal protein L19E
VVRSSSEETHKEKGKGKKEGKREGKRDRFIFRICRAYVEELRSLRREILLRDLYAMGFDPVLCCEDIQVRKGAPG